MDEFTRLVENLNTGKLGITNIQNAIRTHIHRNKNVPDEAKSLLCGSGENDAGIIADHFALMIKTIGSFELAILRTKQKG